MKDIGDLLGRVFLSFIFLYEAYDSIFYMKQTQATMTEYGITWHQNLLFYGTVTLLVLGGLMILSGYRASLGAFMLLLYWVPVTLIVHSFWNDPVVEERMQAIHFMKNIAITGGLLMVWVNGAGRFSIKRLFATAKVPNA